MASGVYIKATFGGQPMSKLGQIIQDRMTYLHETARDSIAATAIIILRSVRSVTKVAKKSSMKVDVKKEGTLFPSFTSNGTHKKLCIRVKGSNARYTGNESIATTSRVPMKTQHVFKFTDQNRKVPKTYLIIAPSMGEAKRKAKDIVKRRGMRYAGLAKRAISMLMFKTNTKTVNDGLLNPVVESKANETTSKKEVLVKSQDGKTGKYGLILNDVLRYALKAIKGGKAMLDTQAKKAMNKVVSVINMKTRQTDFLGNKIKLDSPFPEVRRNKK